MSYIRLHRNVTFLEPQPRQASLCLPTGKPGVSRHPLRHTPDDLLRLRHKPEAIGLTLDVHLSADPGTARRVGRRHGPPMILKIAAGRMQQSGFLFYRSDNGVWLVDSVPAEYLQIVEA